MWPCLACRCDDYAHPGSVHDVEVITTAERVLLVEALRDVTTN